MKDADTHDTCTIPDLSSAFMIFLTVAQCTGGWNGINTCTLEEWTANHSDQVHHSSTPHSPPLKILILCCIQRRKNNFFQSTKHLYQIYRAQYSITCPCHSQEATAEGNRCFHICPTSTKWHDWSPSQSMSKWTYTAQTFNNQNLQLVSFPFPLFPTT